MSAHLLGERIHIHPPPQSRIIIARSKIIKVNIKLLLIFLPAKLILIRIPHIRRGWDDGNLRAGAIKTYDVVMELIANFFKFFTISDLNKCLFTIKNLNTPNTTFNKI